jgi:dTDP-4-dehydrorhamnose reductase
MRVAVTGERGQIVSALSEHAILGAEAVAFGRPKFDAEGAAEVVGATAQRPANSRLGATNFTPAYGFSLVLWTKSLPVGVEHRLEQTPRGDPPSVGPSPSELQTAD